MKDRKRLIVYPLLALPFIVFGIFYMTLDPVARASFFGEFKAKTAAQFGFGDDTEVAYDQADSQGASSESGAGGRSGGGGFDPTQFFSRRDEDGDGKLTGDEISDRMRENLERIDTNQDGSVTLEEFQAGMPGRGGGGGGFDPAQYFSRRDEDGDGRLTGDEISDRMRENLEEIDTDQDDAISLEEFQARMQQMRVTVADGPRGGFGGRDPRDGRPERPQRPE